MKTLATFTEALSDAITEAMLATDTKPATDIAKALECNGVGGGGIYLLGFSAEPENAPEYSIAFVAAEDDRDWNHQTKDDVEKYCHLIVELPVRKSKIAELRYDAMSSSATANQVARIFARRNAGHAAYMVSDAICGLRWSESSLCDALRTILSEAKTPELPGLN